MIPGEHIIKAEFKEISSDPLVVVVGGATAENETTLEEVNKPKS